MALPSIFGKEPDAFVHAGGYDYAGKGQENGEAAQRLPDGVRHGLESLGGFSDLKALE